MKLTFELSLKTDYHVGSGYGLGSHLDSVLLRDSDGTLVIRSIEQLLRDGMWRLLQLPALSKHYQQHKNEEKRRKDKQENTKDIDVLAYCPTKSEEEPLFCPLCRIFGTPAFPKRWHISSAQLQGSNTEILPQKWSKKTDSQQVFRNRVNLRMRRAEDKKLFSQEEGDKNLKFIFTAEASPTNAILDEAALLVASSRMVRHLGSSRRRGRGECVINLTKLEFTKEQLISPKDTFEQKEALKSLLNHFGQWLDGDDSRTKVTFELCQNLNFSNIQSAQPIRRLVILRTDQPLLIARRMQAGNEFDGVDYIQGTAMLGALANLAVEHCGISRSKKSNVYEFFVNAFKRDNIRFSPLFPATTPRDNRSIFPAIPSPSDLFTCQIYPGFSHITLGDTRQHAHSTKPYAINPDLPEKCSYDGCDSDKLLGFGEFLSIEKNSKEVKLKKYNGVHTRINPYTQKIAEGNLFNYVAIDSRQYFVGEVWCKDETFWHQLCELTGQISSSEENSVLHLKIGKATRRGYGTVTAWIGKFANTELLWIGNDLSTRVNNLEQPITLTLLSDAILVDQWGRSKLTLKDPKWLKELLGTEVEIINCFCQSNNVDGFNNVLGLPQWRDIAIKVGSVVGFKFKLSEESKLNLDDLRTRLKEIENNGIGLRRNEGFGRVVFNHPIYNDGNIGQDYRIPLDREKRDELKLSKQTEDIQIKHKLEKWLDISNFKDFTSEKYVAVARWMYHIADKEPIIDTIIQTLKNFGDAWELPGREKKGKKDDEDITKNFIAYLEGRLNILTTLNLSAKVQQKAIQMLADKISDASKSK